MAMFKRDYERAARIVRLIRLTPTFDSHGRMVTTTAGDSVEAAFIKLFEDSPGFDLDRFVKACKIRPSKEVVSL